jgi:cytoskeletal protein RodZ
MNENTSLSQQLRRAREERGESLEDIHKKSSISLEVLRGLETDRFDIVEPVYTRMVLAEYADRLGMDAESILRQFDRSIAPILKVSQPPPLGTAAPIPSRSLQPGVLPRWLFRGGLAALILLIVAVVAFRNGDPPPDYQGISSLSGSADTVKKKKMGEDIDELNGVVAAPDEGHPPSSMATPMPASVATRQAPDLAATPDTPTPAAVESTTTPLAQRETGEEVSLSRQDFRPSLATNDSVLVLEIEAVDSTWVQIKWDEGGIFEATVLAGFKRRWEARNHFLIHSGRAHGIRYWFQGELLGGGTLGHPAKVLRFTASNEGVTLLGADSEFPASTATRSP